MAGWITTIHHGGQPKQKLTMIAGWWFQPIWKIWVNWDDDIPNIWKNNKRSKPPTRLGWFSIYKTHHSRWRRYHLNGSDQISQDISGHLHVKSHLVGGIPIILKHGIFGWFKGKITGQSHISWEHLWFPVKFFHFLSTHWIYDCQRYDWLFPAGWSLGRLKPCKPGLGTQLGSKMFEALATKARRGRTSNFCCRDMQISTSWWYPTPLKNMKVNWDDYSKYMGK